MKEPLFISLCLMGIMWIGPIQAQRDLHICHLFPHGSKLRHPDDCSQEIICEDGQQKEGLKCTGTKPFYNKDTHKCEAQLNDHTTCSVDCTDMEGMFVEDHKSCYGFFYCVDEELAQQGHCPEKYHFNETQQSCVYEHTSSCGMHKLDFCSVVKPGVKFRDLAHCGKYYECIKNKKGVVTLEHKFCDEKNLFYHGHFGKCVPESTDANCHPVPNNACGTGKKIKRKEFISDSATCGGMFYCADVGSEPDLKPKWHQCPDGKFFSEAKKACMDPLEVDCKFDRCEGSNRPFVVSSKSGCRNYLVCKDGVKIREGDCGNYFFDEKLGTCTAEVIKYPACYHK